MLAEAAELVATRQPSKKKPPTYGDYRKLLAEQKPEIVLIGTPDHWHCLPMVEACKAGADVYVQKPISYDVVEGQAMVAAARKYNRTVQVGLQRRSTPHLLEARDKYHPQRQARQDRLRRNPQLLRRRPATFRRTTSPPETSRLGDVRRPGHVARLQPRHPPARWRNCREFSNGQTGDLCVHFFDVVRYFLDLGWPQEHLGIGGILMRDKNSSVNTHDTQTAIFDYGDLQIVWTQRNWGAEPRPEVSVGRDAVRRQGHAQDQRQVVRLHSQRRRHAASTSTSSTRAKSIPRTQEHKETEIFAAPATRRHMQNFLAARRDKQAAGRRHRARPHLLGLLHPGQPLDGARPQPASGTAKTAASSATTKPTAPRPRIPRRLEASHAGERVVGKAPIRPLRLIGARGVVLRGQSRRSRVAYRQIGRPIILAELSNSARRKALTQVVAFTPLPTSPLRGEEFVIPPAIARSKPRMSKAENHRHIGRRSGAFFCGRGRGRDDDQDRAGGRCLGERSRIGAFRRRLPRGRMMRRGGWPRRFGSSSARLG